jgi:hypothetical protein
VNNSDDVNDWMVSEGCQPQEFIFHTHESMQQMLQLFTMLHSAVGACVT